MPGHPESKVEVFLRDEATEPMTITQIADTLDMSRNGVYSWRNRNEDKLIIAGRARGGGETYVHKDSTLAPGVARIASGGTWREPSADVPDPSSLLGTRLLVRSLAIVNEGAVAVELVTDDGRVFSITLDR